MIARLAAALALVAPPAQATVDGWPALYDVTGVEVGDVLNIREGPTASTGVLGSFAAEAEGIEVLGVDRDETWGMVNTAEGTGWVSMRFLQRRPGQWAGHPPEEAACFGTEPFWSMRLDGDKATFASPEALPSDFDRRVVTRSLNRIDRNAGLYENDLGGLLAVLSNSECSDGMSDRSYGWSVDVLISISGDANAQMFSGCCSIAVDQGRLPLGSAGPHPGQSSQK